MNTLNSPNDHDLNRRLSRQADEFARRGGTELEIGQVLSRAGEIRRARRMRASLVMAASVLAIAVPTAMVALDRDNPKDIQPAPPVPTKIDRSPITLDGLEQGDQPRVGYLANGIWNDSGVGADLGADGKRIVEVAPFQGGYLVATQADSGDLSARVVDQTGRPVGTNWPTDGGFAVSEGGAVAAFVQPDGTPIAVQGETSYELPKIPAGSGFQAAAVVGEDCSPQAENGGCAVWVVSKGEQPETWVVTPDRVAPSDLSVRSVVLSGEGELVAGITEVKDDLTTCSEVLRFEGGAALWEVCGHHPVAFSPDGDRLLAEADGDGLGTTGLAVYDSETGNVLLELDTEREAAIPQTIWEDDHHLLATVFEKGQWAILRIGLDGSREYAVAPVEGEDLESPFMLPSR